MMPAGKFRETIDALLNMPWVQVAEQYGDDRIILIITTNEGRSQFVNAGAEQDETGAEAVWAVTKIGVAPVEPAELRTILEYNLPLNYCRFAVMGGDLVCCYRYPLDELEHLELAKALSEMALAADRVEQEFYGIDRY